MQIIDYSVLSYLLHCQFVGAIPAGFVNKDKYGVKGCANALKELGIAYNARWEREANEDENDDIISS